ncbi:MAG: HlyD family secretion protein [Hyphomicrobiaceae bacterium]
MSRSAMKPVEVLSEEGQFDSSDSISQNIEPSARGSDQAARAKLRGQRVVAEKPAEATPAARVADAVPDTDARQAETRPAGRKKVVFGIIGALALAGAIGFGAHWWMVGRFHVSTDDAYVGADIAQLSARVAARVESVPVAANQHVRKGDVLVRLDDTDFRLAVDQAKAKLATQEASITRFSRQIEAAKAAVTQAQAQLDSANAESERAEADFKRIQALAKSQYNSVASLDTARANRDKARAAVEAAKAGITSAEANISVLEAQKIEAERTAGEFRVTVAKAEWDLDSTVVRAPIDGFVGNKSVQVGDYTTAGKRLAAVVPDEAVYIDANFKETQLAGIRPGAHVAVSVDAADGKAIDGTVMSIAPATGSQFSLLPPENATGNFTKIVQRVPVRISVPKEAVERGFLRPGLSVIATVDIRTGTANTPAAAPNQSDQHVQASNLQGAAR